MKSLVYFLQAGSILLLSLIATAQLPAEEPAPAATLKHIPFNEVKLEDTFFKPRMEIQKQVLLPFAFEKTHLAVENLRKTAQFLKGDKSELPEAHRFVSSDLYKVMEGASYLLMLARDPQLEAKMDRIIEFIEGAQEPSGYLYESHTTGVSKNHAAWGAAGMGDKPYSWVIHSHELYDVGHMYEAAVAYYQATGKDKWLKLSEKNAQHVNKVFFEGDPEFNDGKPVNQAPGHQEIELALIKLHRATGKPLYLDMAKKFLDIRGVTFIPDGTDGCMSPTYAQQHAPVRDQREAVGHAVRAGYMYAAMAEVSALTKDDSFQYALNDIWNDIVNRKMHIHGGLGAVHGIEGFGPAFELPNKTAYCETCAAVANVLFNDRMFLMSQDAKYIDVAEVALYNNVLACVSLEGNRFFYVNPLEADGKTPFNAGKPTRGEWFYAACCPTNMARMIPQIQGMAYAVKDNELFTGFYMANETTASLTSGKVSLKQETGYPYDGTVSLTLTPEHKEQAFTLALRIPTWTSNRSVPGYLYHYTLPNIDPPRILVNGKEIPCSPDKGYVKIDRTWRKGDTVELILPMEPLLSWADNRILADKGRVCLTRGPLVYCAEETDNGKGVLHTVVPDRVMHPKQGVFTDGIMKGIPYLDIDATVYPESRDEGKFSRLRLIPYFAWCNRGQGEMQTWFPTKPELLIYDARMGKSFKNVTATDCCERDIVEAIVDSNIPTSSADEGIPRWTSYPNAGKEQIVTLELKEPTPLRSFSIYWFDDNKGVRTPKSWSLEYRKDGAWHPFALYATDAYSVDKDRFNVIHPEAKLEIDAFRISITPQDDYAVGILEASVEREQ